MRELSSTSHDALLPVRHADGMKMFASVLALVLVGLTAGWLWVDATSTARQDTEGIVISGPVDPATVTELGRTGSERGGDDAAGSSDAGSSDAGGEEAATSSASRPAALDQVVTLLSASSDELFARADANRQEEARARADRKAERERAAEERAAEQKAAEQKAAEKKAAEERARRQEQQEQPVQQVPVQPATPPGAYCEWDDDHAEWDCEDDGEYDDNGGDDWDDDDWDDDR